MGESRLGTIGLEGEPRSRYEVPRKWCGLGCGTEAARETIANVMDGTRPFASDANKNFFTVDARRTDGMHVRGKGADEVLGYSDTVEWFAKFDPAPSELRDLSAEELVVLFPQGLIAGLSGAGCALLERKRRRSIFRVIRGGRR